MQKQKIKLAMMTSTYVGDGSSFIELARRLDPERFDLFFISLKKRSGDPDEGVDKDGRKVYYLTRGKHHNIFGPLMLLKLGKILKSEKADILHVHRHKPSFYAFLSRFFIPTPVHIVHVHGLNRTKTINRRLLNRFMFSKFDKVIGCAKKVRDDVRNSNPGIDIDKVIALENSIDYDKYAEAVSGGKDIRKELGVPEDAFLFLALGRFAPTKGFGYLIDAFSKVRKKNPNCHLLMLGNGRDRDNLEEQAKNLGLNGSIHMPGRRPDIPQVMKACNCFVMSSIAEGMPLSLLEAMSSGLPCVSTGVGGIPEVINSDDVGMVVESANADALAEAMMRIAEMSDQERSLLIEKARNRVKTHYSHEVLLNKLSELYENELKFSSVV